ncbi:MAG: V-type ATP synthase subunit F [Sulfuricaulis sp.]
MSAANTIISPTRMIVLGSAALAEGFGLIGVETYPDATPETLEVLLAGLFRRQEKALVFLEHDLARSEGPWLKRVREEGGRIVIAEIPPLHAPEAYHPQVEDIVRSILGSQALEPS